MMHRSAWWPTTMWLAMVGPALAQHQTPNVSPVQIGSPLPYQVELRAANFGAAELPTLHSYAAAHYQGKWVLVAGRTNGLHGFENGGSINFPEVFQNRDVWVIDPAAGQSWRRSLEDASAGLTAAQVDSLTPTNNQFTQLGDRLYMTGGYGTRSTGGFTTFDTLSAIDLPGIVDWVQNGAGMATDHIRQVSDPLFKVTGGAMYEMNDQLHLVFGQDFNGGYNPASNGDYTNQVRSFDVVDDGVTLSFANAASTTPEVAYRRRDLNVFPVLTPDGAGGENEGLVALSGVFTEANGAWTVPVEINTAEIDAALNVTMDDPALPGTFKQAANNYHSAKLGLYSQSSGEMHELLFGGITLQYFDETTGSFVQDDNLPWTSQITSVRIDNAGEFSQHYLGAFPEMFDMAGNALRFGANAEFFAGDDINVFDNGVLNLDALPLGETVVGHIFGGIVSNSPHVRNVPGAVSAASDQVFEVVITRVPEPSSAILLAALVVVFRTAIFYPATRGVSSGGPSSGGAAPKCS